MNETSLDPLEYLRRLGEQGEGPYDLAMAALMLAALDNPGRPLSRYRAHLEDLAAAAKRDLKLVFRVEEAAALLAQLLNGQYGYEGDRLTYDNAENADLIAVIDRRRGLPVTLGILYIHAARAAGLSAAGLNTPGHFLMRLDLKGQAVIIDPFNGGSGVAREQLRGLPAMGGMAPGEAQPGETVNDADVLLRLANNLKLRAIKAGQRDRALILAGRMALIAPRRPEVMFDLAQLSEAQGSLGAASRAYAAVLRLAQSGAPLHNEAALALGGLKRRLN